MTRELRRAADRLVNQIAHWTPSRFGAASSVSGRTRADILHGTVQRIADIAADAEGQPRRAVPRLDNDLALPDQLRVVVADLLAAAPSSAQVDEALTTLSAASRQLSAP